MSLTQRYGSETYLGLWSMLVWEDFRDFGRAAKQQFIFMMALLDQHPSEPFRVGNG